jgi:AraC-like DNA-binding protein
MDEAYRKLIGKEKHLIAGAAFYFVMRREKKPISLKEIAQRLHVSIYKLGSVYRRLKMALDIAPLQQLDPSIYVARICGRLIELSAEEQQTMAEKARLSIAWYRNYSGGDTARRPETIAAASTCLIWDTIHGDESKHSYHLKRVAQTLDIPSSTIQQTYTSIKNAWIQASYQLPWGKEMTKTMFFTYAKDFLNWLPILSFDKATTSYLEEEKLKKMDLAIQHLNALKDGTPSSLLLLDRHVLMYERYILMGLSKEYLLSLSLQDLERMDDQWNTTMSFTDDDLEIYLRPSEEIHLIQNLDHHHQNETEKEETSSHESHVTFL